MAAEKQRKTFLSYSRANKDFAIRLAKELKSEGFDIWLDQLDIPLGARWDVEVEKALEESEIFLIIMTPASIGSENVRDEIGYAIDNGKRFLPVLLENCTVPLRLRRFQYVDFTNKSFDEGVEAAKGLLRGLVAQPTIPRAEFTGAQVQAEVERKEKEEADRLAALKAEEERLAKEKAGMDRWAKEEAERLFAQKLEEERLAKAKAEAERKAKTEARRKTKEEADRLSAQKTEDERLVKQRADEELAAKAILESERKEKEEADRLAGQKFEEQRLAMQNADVLAAKANADRLVTQKAEEDRLAKQKAEEELAAKAILESERKAKEEADRLATQKAEVERLAAQKAEAERKAKEKAMPAVVNAEPVSTVTTQKRPISKGLVFGGIAMAAVVACAVAGYGIYSYLNGAAGVPTEAPLVSNAATEAPIFTEPPAATETPTPTETLTPTETPTAIVVDGDADDWQDTSNCITDGPSQELAKWLDFKRVCYLIQGDNIYILMELFGDITQDDPVTKLTAYGLSFSPESNRDATPVVELWYIPNYQQLELTKWDGSRSITLELGRGEEAASNKNYIEIRLPISIIQEYISTPYLQYRSGSDVETNNCGFLICAYYPEDSDPSKFIPISLTP